MKLALFAKNKSLEAEIDEFLDTVSQGGMLFEETLNHFISHGADEIFADRQSQISEVESNGDRLVKSIVRALYSEKLIPESRADVLSLLQDMDALLDQYEQTCFAVDVERPEIADVSEELKTAYRELVRLVVQSVEVLIAATRAFFRDINAVRDHIHKVNFIEGEADKIAIYLKREIFRSEFPLDRKMHLRHFVDKVDSIADEAEDTADWLAIYTIKRSL
jgi:predicted phosphate transport protein (TIGR00153 family)